MKEKYDPREIMQVIERHKRSAQEAAKKFAEDMQPGNSLDIKSESFGQGVPKPDSEPSK